MDEDRIGRKLMGGRSWRTYPVVIVDITGLKSTIS